VRASRRAAARQQPESIGARIDAALAESKLTQSDLARILAGPLAEPTRVASIRRLIAKWRRDEHRPSAEYAVLLAETFAKPRSYFAPQAAAEIEASEPSARSMVEIDAIEFVRQAAVEVNEANGAAVGLPKTKAEVAKLVPQFNSECILIDRVVELVPGERVVAEKKFSPRDWRLGEWYTGTTIIPGLLVLEALAQASALVLLAAPQNRGRIALSAGFDSTRFKRIVKSGEKVRLECVVKAVHGPIAHARLEAWVGLELAVRGELILAVH
jgi:3-hydroxyacyl-[acyl-carrier-protein] dehydratase